MIWARMLAYITGTVDQELLLRNEYLAAENRILRAQIKGRLLLSDAEKATLAEIAHRLGRKALAELAAVAKPDTLLAWYRKLIANKFDGSKFRKSRGRPRVDEETEQLVVRMAKENPGWGYDRIVGAMANLGLRLSDQTVGNILRRHDIPPAPQRKQATSWKDFIRAHMAVLVATDFFTVEVLTLKGLVTYYVLFFIQLESRRVCLAGITPHPDQQWMDQMGTEVFAHNGVPASTDDSQIRVDPSAAYNPATKEIFLSWQEQDSLQFYSGVFAQKFDASGNRMWTDTGLVIVPLQSNDAEIFERTVQVGDGAFVFWIDEQLTMDGTIQAVNQRQMASVKRRPKRAVRVPLQS